jgi:ZIP family zinc transporter
MNEVIMNINLYSIISAFVLSLIAGLSTGLGGCIALFAKNTNTRFLSISLGFSAGVMIYVSMIEILKEANEFLNISFGIKLGSLYTIIGFFFGMLLVGLIKRLIPNNIDNYISKGNKDIEMKSKLFRTGLFTALAIALHNFPEGIATFISSIHSLVHAIPIVIAIALHNIPEGISVSVPIYCATNNKHKAFLYSLISGMAEPLGALIGYLILMPLINNTVFGILYSVIAGIMVYISFDELLPAAKEYGKHSLTILGLVFGMIFMSLSLWLFI